MVHALSLTYDAIAGNSDTLETDTTTLSCVTIDSVSFLKCSCEYKISINAELTLYGRDILFCPKCGKKIINFDY